MLRRPTKPCYTADVAAPPISRRVIERLPQTSHYAICLTRVGLAQRFQPSNSHSGVV